MKRLIILTAVLILSTNANAQTIENKDEKRSLSIGINPIQIYRNGNTQGILLKYYNKDQSSAWRLFPSASFNNSKTKNQNINNINIPDSLGLSSTKNNQLSLRLGFEKTFYSKNKFSSYGIMELGISYSKSTSNYPRLTYRASTTNPNEGVLTVRDRDYNSHSSQLNAIFGIGAKYKLYKNLSLSLESSILGGPSYTKSNNYNNNYKQYEYVNNQFTLINEQKGSDIKNKTVRFNANLNPNTTIFLAYRF